MKVKDVMTKTVHMIGPKESAAKAGLLMSKHGCGIIPVVDAKHKVVGVITDRDLCLSLVKANAKPSDVKLDAIMTTKPYLCSIDDSIETALDTMRLYKVRRLPVIDANGELKGILSLDDLILKSRISRVEMQEGPSYGDVIGTFKDICAHQVVGAV